MVHCVVKHKEVEYNNDTECYIHKQQYYESSRVAILSYNWFPFEFPQIQIGKLEQHKQEQRHHPTQIRKKRQSKPK
jgi:hypothetical protein